MSSPCRDVARQKMNVSRPASPRLGTRCLRRLVGGIRLELPDPTVDVLLGVVLDDAVAFLKPAEHLLALASDELHVIASEFGPPRSDVPRELVKLAFDLCPIHRALLAYSSRRRSETPRASAERCSGPEQLPCPTPRSEDPSESSLCSAKAARCRRLRSINMMISIHQYDGGTIACDSC